MRKQVGLMSVAVAAVVVAVLVVGVVQLIRYRQIQTSQLRNLNQPSSVPQGLVVALNAPSDTAAKGVLVNYLSPDGVAVRTRPIPNVLVKQARFQVVQDDVFVYQEQEDEPSFRRMDESGTLSAGVSMHRGVSGDDSWLVSSDGQRVAWSETSVDQGMTTSVLFSAGIDGSDKQQLASVVEAGEFYLRPVMWVETEPDVWQVWYVKQSVGAGEAMVFADPLGPIFANGQIIFPETQVLTGAGQAAEGTWSPDQKFVAVASAVGNPEAESGWVEIWDVSQDTSIKISPEVSTDILHIVGWLDHDTLALAVLDADHPLQSHVYVVNTDGSFFRKVWDGYPIGVVPAVE